MPLTDSLQSLLPPGSWVSNTGSSEGEWSQLPPMRSKRHGSAAVALGEKTLVVMGGHDGGTETDSVEVFKLEDGVWKTTAGTSLRTRRLGCVAATLTSDEANPGSKCIVVVGGHNGRALDSAERYHPMLDMWTESPSLPIGAMFYAAAVGIHNRLYVIGGHDGKKPSNQVNVFDSNFCIWATAPPMTEQRFQFGVTALGKYIYVVGGDNGTALRSMESYDTVSKTWTPLPSMISKRKGCVAASVGSCIYVFGGHDGNNVLNSCERYNPCTRCWSTLPPMKCRRFGSAIAVLENHIFILGGFDGTTGLCSVEQFTVFPHAHAEVDGATTSEGSDGTDGSVTEASPDDEPPATPAEASDELLCPITGDLMVDPIVASDGFSYEREAIEEWFRQFSPSAVPRSPTTNGPIERRLFPNHNLKSLCRRYANTNPSNTCD